MFFARGRLAGGVRGVRTSKGSSCEAARLGGCKFFFSDGKGGRDDDDANNNPSMVEILKPSSDKNSSTPSGGDVVSEGDVIPKHPHVLALPVTRRPLFPGIILPLTVETSVAKSIEMVQRSGHSYVGVFLRKDEGGMVHETDEPVMLTGADSSLITDLDEIYRIGTFARVHQIIHGQDTAQVLT